MARSSFLVVLAAVLLGACAPEPRPASPIEVRTTAPAEAPPTDAGEVGGEPSAEVPLHERLPSPTDAGAAPALVELDPAQRAALASALTRAASRFARGELDAGLQILESATSGLPIPDRASEEYPRGAVRELAVAREAIIELRGALAKGGGGVVLMDAINLVFDHERDHPILQPLAGYTMRLLEKETKSLPDVEACESAVRWVGGLRYRGGRPPPYTAVLYERFRHRLVCRKPCDAPYPGCGAW